MPPRGRPAAIARGALVAALAACAAGATACWDGRHVAWERERAVIGPIPLKAGAAYVDSARDRVITIDASENRPRVVTARVGRRAVFATPTPDRRHLAVITRGEEALREGEVDEAPALWLVDPTTPGATPVAYPIGSPFDRLAISRDGTIAVAHFSSGGPDADGFFRNPNELAIARLDRPPGPGNPVLKTVRAFGAAPDGVVLSPPMVIPGADDPTPRVLAFVLAPGNITIVDATYPERREVSIRLDLGGPVVRPRELVFARTTATVYVRSDNARDVLEILLGGEEPRPGDPLDNDYQPALAELGAGAGPADIAVWDDAAGRRLILAATPGAGEVVVIDADTAAFRAVPTPDPIDRVLLFSDGTDAPPRFAVLAALGARLPRVHVLRLDDITDELVTPELDAVTLERPVRDVVAVPGRELAMVVHDDDRTVLGLLDVALGAVSPLEGVGRLDSFDFSPDGAFLIGATDGVDRIGFLALDNLHPTSLALDDAAARVLALHTGAVLVDHGDPFGRATIIPSPAAQRTDAIVLESFLLSGLFDEEF